MSRPADAAGAPTGAAAGACAVCGAPQQTRFKPFCSKRCADIDLGRWLNGVYAVPAVEAGDPPGEDDGG